MYPQIAKNWVGKSANCHIVANPINLVSPQVCGFAICGLWTAHLWILISLAPPLLEAIISAADSTAWFLPLLLFPDHNQAVAAADSTAWFLPLLLVPDHDHAVAATVSTAWFLPLPVVPVRSKPSRCRRRLKQSYFCILCACSR
jgi:hypothetical protein